MLLGPGTALASHPRDPDAWLAAERERAELRRRRVVEDMRRRLAPSSKKLEAQQEEVREIDRTHARTAMGDFDGELTGLVQALEEARAPRLTAAAAAHRLRRIAVYRDTLLERIEEFPRLARLEGERLAARALPALALRRHAEFVRETSGKMRRLAAALRELQPDPTGGDVPSRATQQRLVALAQQLGWSPPQGNGITRMPTEGIEHSDVEAKAGRLRHHQLRPRYLSSEGGARLRGGPFPVLRGAADWLLTAFATRLPWLAVPPTLLQEAQVEDLAETVAAARDEAVSSLAAELGHDPVRIFQYVRNSIDSEVYFGSLKGSRGTLAELAGNDMDQASLLIALLRAAGTPARYEYGVVKVPVGLAREIANVEDDRALAQVFGSQGVPGTLAYDPQTRKAVALFIEHVWVRALVPYEDYRGHAAGDGTGKSWVSLDPYFKRYSVTPGEHFRHTLPAGSTFFDDYLEARQPRTPVETWFDQIRDEVRAQGRECDTPLTLARHRRIIPSRSALLPELPPVEIISTDGTFAEVPAALQHSVVVAVRDRNGRELIRYEREMPEVYGRSLGVAYPPATAADQQIADTEGGLFEAPAYLLRLSPAIYDNGVEVIRGDALLPGARQQIDIVYGTPDVSGFRWTPISHRSARVGGAYSALIGHGSVPDGVVAQQEALLRELEAAGAASELLALQQGQVIGMRYYQQVSESTDAMTAVSGYVWTHDPFEGLGGRRVGAEQTVFGRTVGLADYGQFLDIKLTGLHVHPVDGDRRFDATVAKLFGFEGSNFEHIAIEQGVGVEALSTIKALQLAREGGLSFIDVDQHNVDEVLAQITLHPDDEADIRRYVHMGRVGRIPMGEVTLNQWRGAGYFLLYPDSNWGCYLISGGLMGGQSSGGGGGGTGDNNGSCSCTCASAGSRANLSSGSYSFAAVDLALPALGLDAAIVRAYRSTLGSTPRLAPGWTMTFGEALLESSDGSVDLQLSDGRVFTFQPDGQGGYARPAGLYATLSRAGELWQLLDRDGVEREFDAFGRLNHVADRNGNRLSIQRDAQGEPLRIEDDSGRALIELETTAGRITALTDIAGRRVTYAYDGDLLVQVDGLDDETELFTYDFSQRLTAKEMPGAASQRIVYDARGWFSHSVDGLGGVRRASYSPSSRRAVMRDRLGHATVWEYDADGHPTRRVDALGNLSAWTWDTDGNKLSSADDQSTLANFAWDADGRLESRSDDLGTVSFDNDPRGFGPVSAYDSAGLLWSQGWDANGNLTSTSIPDGETKTYGYDDQGLKVSETTSGLAPIELEYDEWGELAVHRNVNGATVSFDRNAFGAVTGVVDRLGRDTTFVVDAHGRTTEHIDPASKHWRFEYHPNGQLLSFEDPTHRRLEWRYDAIGRLVERHDPATGDSQRRTLDAEGRLVAASDSTGATMRFRYDALGRLIETENAAGEVTSFGYCADLIPECVTCGSGSQGSAGCRETVDPAGRLTREEYDLRGRLIRRIDGEGGVTQWSYDARDLLTQRIDPDGRIFSYAYDNANRLVELEDHSGERLRYELSAFGKPLEIIDGSGNVTSYSYDDLGRLTREVLPGQDAGDSEAGSWFIYDDANHLVERRSAGMPTTFFDYDAANRVVAIRRPGAPDTTFAYDDAGRRTLESNGSEQRSIHYDARGLPQRIENLALGKALELEHDGEGRRTAMTLDEDLDPTTPPDLRWEYRRDPAGRLSSTSLTGVGEVRLLRDPSGLRIGTAFPNGAATVVRYDQAARPVSSTFLESGARVFDQVDYELSAAGLPLSATRQSSGATTFEYDSSSRLILARYPNGRRIEYSYDASGNRLTMTTTPRAGATPHTTQYRYDGAGRLRCHGPSAMSDLECSSQENSRLDYDAAGRLTAEHTWTDTLCLSHGLACDSAQAQSHQALVRSYEYTPAGELSRVLQDGSVVYEAEYDARGLAVQQAQGGTHRGRLLDGDHVVAEYDASGNRTRALLRAEGWDQWLAIDESGTTRYLHTDMLGSTLAATDAAGRPSESRDFDAFGLERSVAGATAGGAGAVRGFAGREPVAALNGTLHYLRARYFRPDLGRFMTRDPFNFGTWESLGFGRSTRPPVNGYAYANGLPTLLGDPLGLCGAVQYRLERILWRGSYVIWWYSEKPDYMWLPGVISNVINAFSDSCGTCVDYALALEDFLNRDVKSKCNCKAVAVPKPNFLGMDHGHYNVDIKCCDDDEEFVLLTFDPWNSSHFFVPFP